MSSIRRFVLGVVASSCVLSAAGVAAQTTANADHPYGLDPYKPSDAAWLRNYGAVLVAETSVLELAALDPYKPTHAALARQVGGAMPFWVPDWLFPGSTLGPVLPMFARRVPPPMLSVTPVVGGDAAGYSSGPSSRTREATASPSAGSAASALVSIAMLNSPRENDGISIRFGGRTWLSAGRAVPLQAGRFARIGEHAGLPVYERTDVNEGVIYVPARDGLIAPFRAKP